MTHPPSRRDTKGITLVEVIITAAILAIVVFLGRVCLNIINQSFSQNSLIQVEAEAQNVLYSISRDVRNCEDILFVSSDTLILSAYNFSAYGFTSTDLVKKSNLGTITYRYDSTPSNRHLNRKTVFTVGGSTDTTQRALLKNVLVSPTIANYIFLAGPNPFPPYETVDIVLRLKPPSRKGAPIIYQRKAMKRSHP